jgi:6-phosphogluconolactonase
MRDPSHHRVRCLSVLHVVALSLAASACRYLTPGPGSEALATARRVPVYVGTYTNGGSRGIYRFELDKASGAATAPVLAGESRNPSFLALHPNGGVLYAVNEVADFGGARTGAVSAFAVDPVSGALTLLNQQPSGGADPCHIVTDRSGRNLLVANCTSGTVAVLPLAADGRLRAATSIRHHTGSGPDKARQEGPHAHAILLDAAERYAFEADLGADRIYAYRFDAAGGRLEPNDPEATPLDPGSGPRHLAWHPSGRYLYALNELRSTVAVFRYDAERGALDAIQTITTLPAGFTGKNTAAEIVIDEDARFLYSSNRGDDSLAVFTVDERTGALTSAGRTPTGGRTPRHFAIDRSGRWLLVANQDSDSIAIFHVDPATGRPSPSGRLRVPKPVCVLFAGATR